MTDRKAPTETHTDLDSSNTLEGSCLCGEIRYRARGPLRKMACCHCRRCRKASGAEFGTNADVDADSFLVESGEHLLRSFESSPGHQRFFCGQCGSPLFKKAVDAPDRVRVRLGCVDTPIHRQPIARVFVSEKLEFTRVDDAIPCFATLPGEP